VTPGVITVLKGQLPAFFAGLFTLGLVWLVAACRLARPTSFWAKRFYKTEKMARAKRRYEHSSWE
jgi:hypothetical protein